MRKLVILIGAPAVGKSTFIKEHQLEAYTLSPDNLRELISQPKTLIDQDHVTKAIDWTQDGKVWRLLDQLLKERFEKGQTVIVDATHLFRGGLSRYNQLAKDYAYKIYYIDFMKPFLAEYEHPTTELARRDHEYRNHKIENDAVFKTHIDRYQQLIQSHQLNNLRIFTPQEFVDKFLTREVPINLDQYSKIKIIGDLHGDFSNLEKVFANHKSGTAYIFVGDYLDRGTKIGETYKFLTNLKGKNIFFLRGNHEVSLDHFLQTGQAKSYFSDTTLAKIMPDGLATLQEFRKQFQDYVYFQFNNQVFFVSHAGLDAREFNSTSALKNLFFTDEACFVKGRPSKDLTPYEQDIDTQIFGGGYNVHGHRNNFDRPIINTTAINLNQGPKFRYIVLEHAPIEAKITPVETPIIDGENFYDQLINDPDVKNRELENGLTSHNFTKDVFDNHRWTPITLKARGLFTKHGEIVGRGFNKFFNVDENPTAKLSSLVFPVSIYQKVNGFLALAFLDPDTKEILIETKSGVGYNDDQHTTDTLTIANTVVKQDQQLITKLKHWLKDHNDTTVALEIIAPTFGDQHILPYKTDQAVPIAVINNNTGSFNSTGEAVFDIKPIVTVNNLQELETAINTLNSAPTEGLVLRGLNKLLKVKTNYYLSAKEVRQAFKDHHKRRWYSKDGQQLYQTAVAHGLTKFEPAQIKEIYLNLKKA